MDEAGVAERDAMQPGAIARYWHTVRHLKARQVWGRLWFRMVVPRPDLRDAPALRSIEGAWSAPAKREPRLAGPTEFHLLNESGELNELGWDGPARDKLWRYNQHYFDDLNSIGAEARASWHRDLLPRWIAENPPGSGSGWEPYPTSLRIVNWIKWSLGGNALTGACIHSLAVQVRWLAARLEHHLLGNHLFANAKALIFAGLYFTGPEASRWLERGLRIVAEELPEQVLADGGNFERSTMYHALFFEDLLDLINATRAWPQMIPAERLTGWAEVACRMRAWLRGMCHPDGQIALFNDAAFDVAPAPQALFDYADRLGLQPDVRSESNGPDPRAAHWPESGYLRLETSNIVAFLDVAPVGPDYLPGHAHADTLSFEMSCAGRRVIVNGGTSRYGTGPERARERATRVHSTVEVDGEDSSEVWSGFRVARRAYPFDLVIDRSSSAIRVCCSHDGYRRLPGRPVHRRCWHLKAGDLEVLDEVAGDHGQGIARFLLHPECTIDAFDDRSFAVRAGGVDLLRMEVHTGRAHVEPAHYAPRFGEVLPTRCIAVTLDEGRGRVRFRW
ncbi:MAG: alginate lyase family protein [Pseudomonadales bacterium]|nr:alginate lyase family protein [Pseudomonadales bacterium]